MYREGGWGAFGLANVPGHGITNHSTPHHVVPLLDGLRDDMYKSLSVVGWRANQNDKLYCNTLDVNNMEMGIFHFVNLRNRGSDLPGLIFPHPQGCYMEPRSKWPFFTSFTMIEHFGALPVLLQMPLQMMFEGMSAPYSTWSLCGTVSELVKCKNKFGHFLEEECMMPIKTPENIFHYKSKNGSIIEIHPRSIPGISVDATFDFSKSKKMGWIGQQEWKFDSETDDPLEIASARAPSSAPWFNDFSINFQHKFTHISSVIPHPDKALFESSKMQEMEVARHKILDFLVTCNKKDFFLAADIKMVRAGHKEHLECMQEFFKTMKFKRLN